MSDWIHGPDFIAWLEGEFNFDRHGNGPVIERRAVGLLRGDSISLWSADRFLTNIGLHVALIPDDLWRPPKTRKSPKYTPPRPSRVKAEISQRYQAGESVESLALAAGVTERTVERWMSGLKQKGAQ